jgi:cyanophycinase
MNNKNIKGILIPVGGAEDKGTDLEKGVIERNRMIFFELGILTKIAHAIGDESKRIEVITTASSIPDEVFENYTDAFGKLGYKNIGHIRVRERKDVDTPEMIERLKNCDGIMFTGGNQLRLSSFFGGTDFLKILKDRYENEHFVIAGTSAGAMAMSNTMIYEGNATTAHLKGEVKIATGLGFMHDVIIDSHFEKRGRFPRLAQAVAANPGAIGIGLSEDTGILVKNGCEITAIGSGAVYIFDGKNIGYNNIGDLSIGKPIAFSNLVVHIMSDGIRYNTSTRIFMAEEVEEVKIN